MAITSRHPSYLFLFSLVCFSIFNLGQMLVFWHRLSVLMCTNSHFVAGRLSDSPVIITKMLPQLEWKTHIQQCTDHKWTKWEWAALQHLTTRSAADCTFFIMYKHYSKHTVFYVTICFPVMKNLAKHDLFLNEEHDDEWIKWFMCANTGLNSKTFARGRQSSRQCAVIL